MNKDYLNLLMELLCRLADEVPQDDRDKIKAVQIVALRERDGVDINEVIKEQYGDIDETS